MVAKNATYRRPHRQADAGATSSAHHRPSAEPSQAARAPFGVIERPAGTRDEHPLPWTRLQGWRSRTIPICARDTSNLSTSGFSIGLNLPLFSGNRAAIAGERATRDQLRAEYQARLDQAALDGDKLFSLQGLLGTQRAPMDAHLPTLADPSGPAGGADSRGGRAVMTGDACRRRSPLACDADPRGRPQSPSWVRTAVPQPIEIKLYSDHKDALIQTAKRVADAIGVIPGVVDVSAGVVLAGDAVEIVVDRDMAALEGIDPDQVTQQLNTWLSGLITPQIRGALMLRQGADGLYAWTQRSPGTRLQRIAERFDPEHPATLPLLTTLGSWHLARTWDAALARYQPQRAPEALDVAAWRQEADLGLPRYRVDLDGEREEPLALQWLGTPESLAARLQPRKSGWTVVRVRPARCPARHNEAE